MCPTEEVSDLLLFPNSETIYEPFQGTTIYFNSQAVQKIAKEEMLIPSMECLLLISGERNIFCLFKNAKEDEQVVLYIAQCNTGLRDRFIWSQSKGIII